MAWTARADRFSPIAQNEEVGPGSYGGHNEYKAEPRYAPFGSSKPRATTNQEFSTQDQPRATSPPPGAYDPKLPKAYDSGLPRKHVPFTTGASRSSDVLKAGQAPGPGAYDVVPRTQEALSCRTMGAPPANHPPMLKSTSAPSIPCAHQSYGYEEAGDGRLLRQPPKERHLLFSGKTGDSVGPGHYAQEVGGTVRRAAFGKISPAPAPRQEKADDTPGPGHYASKGLKQNSVTSSFVSSSVQRPKGKEKHEVPGPGSYEAKAQSRADLREVYPDMQYFGSTTERFKDPFSKQVPGPGCYDERKRERVKSSWIKSGRFETDKHAASMPGPGNYEPALDGKSGGPLGTVSILGSTGCLAFGSMESKLGTNRKSDGPGPGAYYTPSSDERAASSGMGRSGRRTRPQIPRSQSAVFRSETALNAMTNLSIKEGQQRPPPGAYTPTLPQDVGTVMRQPPKAEGFLSAAPRGKDVGMAVPSPAPGPGRYDSVIEITGGKKIGSFNRTIVEGAPGRGRPKGLGFESQARRFRATGPKDTPGPGAYDTDPDWITKTHNIHFGDVG